ncbi:Ohr family peroxiredoxin [Rhizorhabdus wittichii]|uniref:Ohr family peroxiredoxin n=1 Tax=Rhizorhabdus wittichii TaxID=160791 RepID=A0A975HC75_9SPHN|nr:Ohr family peroxiredoxin [Rhizorhabdus wittichii]QTH19932.1 Ohr family peroxiredoxin [Rhizorhabdus wittichii]
MRSKTSLYRARATAIGGRVGGAASADGRLRVRLDDPADPVGRGTTPEQLFAAAYAACFLSALRRAAAEEGVAIAPDGNVTAEVSLSDDADAALSVDLSIDLAGLDDAVAARLVAAAHARCPYSKAMRGDARVDVRIV